MPGGRGNSAARGQNGNRSGFRTDTAISNNRPGNERVLQPWVPDADDLADGSLEQSTNNTSNSTKGWDQFAANEQLFGLKTDYDENMYTTAINKSHPQYEQRRAQAERKAREINDSTAATSHVAEERVMDYVASGNDKGDENEEDKYSGVRRQDFPPLGGAGGNKYTPPAKRAPTANSSVKGAPVDPAIISSQIKAPAKKQSPSEESKGQNSTASVQNGVSPAPEVTTAAQTSSTEQSSKAAAAPTESRTTDDVKTSDSASASRTLSPQAKENAPSATETVERDVAHAFKIFASQQRQNAQQARSKKAKADKEVKLTELKKFADSFKLSTPVPGDLVSIIAKDPSRQKEIQAKAIKNAEDVAREKEALKKTPSGQGAAAKTGEQPQAKSAAVDGRAPRAPNVSSLGSQAANRPPRQSFPNQPYPYRNNRGGPQQMHPQQQAGNMGQRIREQQKYGQPPAGYQNMPASDGRAPPTGPANNGDPNASRRLSGAPSLGGKLNPNSHEFRPNAFAAPFNPSAPSASSSPRSAVNNTGTPAPGSAGPSLCRRKGEKKIDLKKCSILSQIQSINPPEGRNWNDNAGLRPSYDTLPTWRQVKDGEEKDESSTMNTTYKQFFDRRPFASSMATPNTGHVLPHVPHQHQLPLHLQHGGPPRQSPAMGHMQMHSNQQGPGPHPPYGQDDHRMVHSNSAQSFSSPRPPQASMAYPGMNSPAPMQYNQPMFMGPGGPQMGQFRSFSNNPQYMPPQHGQMGGPMMMQPHFMPGPQGMGGPQMMYPGSGNPHFMPPGGPPHPGHGGANGYPSPGRPSAPMMAHQGSQQGQPMYNGASPSFSQPATYGPGQQPGGPMSQPRGYHQTGPSPYGTSPQQGHQPAFHRQHRSGSNTYSRNHSFQGQQSQASSSPQIMRPSPSQNQGTDEAK